MKLSFGLNRQDGGDAQRRSARGTRQGLPKRDRYARLARPLPARSIDGEATPAVWKGKARAIDDDLARQSLTARSDPPWDLQDQDGASTSRLALDAHQAGVPRLEARAREDPLGDHPFSLRHNLPMLLLVIVGSIVAFATIVTSLAFILRCCCGWERRSSRRQRRRQRLSKSVWSPSKAGDEKAQDAFADPDLDLKDGKDGVLSMPTTPMPVLLSEKEADASVRPPSYASGDGAKARNDAANAIELGQGAKPSMDGRGWSLFDRPVGGDPIKATGDNDFEVRAMQLPDQASSFPYGQDGQLGNGLPDLEGGRGMVPARRPSFIARVMKQRGSAYDLDAERCDPRTTGALGGPFDHLDNVGNGHVTSKGSYPNIRSLPGYGTETPRFQPGSAKIGGGAAASSRFAGMGIHASRTVLSMIPATLRNAASTSRARHPAHDSDFEGTIGGRDRDLPRAKRIGKKAERFAMEYSTEEEHSPEGFGQSLGLDAGAFGGMLATPGGRPVVRGTPGQRLDFTPGLAGIGAAWPNSQAEVGHVGLSRLAEIEAAALRQQGDDAALLGAGASAFPRLPLPAMDYQRALLEQQLQWEAYMKAQPMAAPHQLLQQTQALALIHHHRQRHQLDGRQRLLSTVSRWQEASRDAEPVYDPYTSAPPSVSGSLRGRPGRLHRGASCRSGATSDVSSISEGSSITGLSALYEGKGATLDKPHHGGLHGSDEQVSRVPSIRPQFAATTTLSSWLEPGQVSTTHGLKSHEDGCWEDVDGDDGRDPFASDVDVEKTRPVSLRSESASDAEPPMAEVRVVEDRKRHRPKAARQASEDSSLRARAVRPAAKKAAKSGYSSATGRRPVYQDRQRSNASSVLSSRTRLSVRSSAALSTGASTNLSSLFDAEPALSRSRRHGDKAAKKVKASSAVKATSVAQNSRRRERQEPRDGAMTAQAPVEEESVEVSFGEESSALSRAASSYLAEVAPASKPAGGNSRRLKRQDSSATMGSFYSELTAPEEYTFRAPMLAPEVEVEVAMAEAEAEKKKKAAADDAEAEPALPASKPSSKPKKRQQQQEQQSRRKDVDADSAEPRQSKPVREFVKPRKASHDETAERPSSQPPTVQPVSSLASAKEVAAPASSARPKNGADYDETDSPWTSSDSDISLRRWGVVTAERRTRR
ncbi:uncharacterized protein PFL1_01227 [Pseudozyma flocculosa PF-1]|uniref:uncharacterized protein n=1 Tax=Pseudozyma flocculosa PF-1 TaxID=1277687 RepID=UPI00045608DF|nr:uncharacterized protein PFL1_01227 [Pseudozyma flocculosa PF-1]EPQ31038.1 hypothetical protein PFL1_01227 [Pseudozyma flocculosa PF-1]